MFLRLAPTADDIWFWWMTRLQGRGVRTTGSGRHVDPWQGSQDTSLFSVNVRDHEDRDVDGNDIAIRAMVDAYGFPVGASDD
jgi:hypothetical protein